MFSRVLFKETLRDLGVAVSVEGRKTALQSARSVEDLSDPDECIRRWLSVGLPSGELGGDGVKNAAVHCYQGSEKWVGRSLP